MVAYGKKKLATSHVAHIARAKSEENTNIKSIQITAEKTTLTVDEKVKTTVKRIFTDPNKMPIDHVDVIRYASSNPFVAKVSSRGRITARGKGSCYIYAYAENGRSTRIKINVE